MRYILSVFLLLTVNYYSLSQKDSLKATLYLSNGKVKTGIINKKFYKGDRIRLLINSKKYSYRKTKIDSIIVDSTKYIFVGSPLSIYTLKVISSGKLQLFSDRTGTRLYLKRDSCQTYIIPSNKYHVVYNIFSGDTNNIQSIPIDQQKFISLVQNYNSSLLKSTDMPVPYDSINRYKKPLITRISLLRPEIGFELKLMDNISLYNSFGINFWGNYFRNAKTFVNYDYSGELRMFYNQKRRLIKGKSNYNFSGPFVAFTYKYMIETNSNNFNMIGVLMGRQDSNLFTKGYGSLRLGACIDTKNNFFYFIYMFSFGWGL